jgi:hypothetical protein
LAAAWYTFSASECLPCFSSDRAWAWIDRTCAAFFETLAVFLVDLLRSHIALLRVGTRAHRHHDQGDERKTQQQYLHVSLTSFRERALDLSAAEGNCTARSPKAESPHD